MTQDDATETWTGTVESLAPDGNGIGTVHERTPDGRPVRRPIFIPYVTPGDRIEARVTARKGKCLFGETLRVIEPSPNRVAPYCPHFSVCGGCDLEHIAYDEQLRQKARIITHQLAKAGVTLPHPIAVTAAMERHRYRCRARIAVRFDDRVNAGFRKRRSREIVPVSACWIVTAPILDFITALNVSQPPAGLSGAETELIVVGEKGKIGVLARMDKVPEAHRRALRTWLEDIYAGNRGLIGNVLVDENRSVRALGQVQEHFSYATDGLSFGFSPETFIQANLSTNETLVDQAMRFLLRERDGASMTIIDLYAGIGNLSLPAAKRGARVIAIEGHEASVHIARTNATRNRLDNVLFLHRSTERYLKEWLRHRADGKTHPEHPAADAIIVDPPRTGLSAPARVLLARAGVPRIVYVSCDAATLARDLRHLAPAYRLADIAGIDMFPDISHVETVCLLERS